MGRIGTPDAQPRKYQLTELQDTHREILRRAAIGQKHVDIAREMSITTATVANAVNSELGRARVEALHSLSDYGAIDVGKRIKETCALAQIRLEQLMHSENDAVATRVCFGILDRGGYAPVQKSISASTQLTSEELNELINRSVQAGVIQTDSAGEGEVVEAILVNEDEDEDEDEDEEESLKLLERALTANPFIEPTKEPVSENVST